MANAVGGTAVVIGAGMSGLLTARVLADAFDRVLVLDRDALPDGSQVRGGVPQGRHVHAIMARGGSIFEQLFPGLHAALQADGAALLDSGSARLLLPHGWAPQVHSGIPALLASRPFLETHVRDRVVALPNIEVQDCTRVTGLVLDSGGANVLGVRAERRGSGGAWGAELTIDAALVADTSGRTSKLRAWLTQAGRAPAQETVIDGRLGYASRLFDIPVSRRADPAILAEVLHPPHLARGFTALRIEGDRLLVTLQGAAGHALPRDEEGFAAFVRSLRTPLQDTLRDLQPASPIYQFTRTANRRTAYHRMRNWPGGLIALGDAVCTFNPLYAQGMTVAAIEAEILMAVFARNHGVSSAVCSRFQRRVARALAWPWLLATLSDRLWQNERPTRVVERGAHWFFDQWLRAIPRSPMMFHRFLRVAHLLAGPGALVHPRAVWRIARNGLSGHDPDAARLTGTTT